MDIFRSRVADGLHSSWFIFEILNRPWNWGKFIVIEAGDALGLSNAAIKLAQASLEERAQIGQNSRTCYQQLFERDAVLNQFEKHLYNAHAK